MSRFSLATVVLIASIQIPGAAESCIPPPPPLRLPNESIEAYNVRSWAVSRALADEEQRSFQAKIYDRSNRIFLGVVESSEDIDAAGLPGHKVIVRPVAALKGDLPRDQVTLADRYMTTCGPVGGGTATAAVPGDHVVVMEGDLFQKGSEALGLRMNELREPRIFKGLNDVAPPSAATSGNRVQRK